jgi:hypothetical protein
MKRKENLKAMRGRLRGCDSRDYPISLEPNPIRITMSATWKPSVAKGSGIVAPMNRFAVLGEEGADEGHSVTTPMTAPVSVSMPPTAPSHTTPSAAPPLPKITPAGASSADGASGGAGASGTAGVTSRFADRLRQGAVTRTGGPGRALPKPKLDSETEFPSLSGGSKRPAIAAVVATVATVVTVATGAAPAAPRPTFADKAREAAEWEARETAQRDAEEAHWRAERAREDYERSLLVGRFSGMSMGGSDAFHTRTTAYEEEDRMRGIEAPPVEEETNWRAGTPPYPPTTYIPGVDDRHTKDDKEAWGTGEQEEAW